LLLRGAPTTIAGILIAMVSGGALAGETTTPDNSGSAISGNGEPPPGGCLPIGVTASGEVVFPLLCKDFLEKNRGAAAASKEQKPTSEHPPSADQKADHDNKMVTDQREAQPAEKAQAAPTTSETVSSIKSTNDVAEQKQTSEQPLSPDQADHDSKTTATQQGSDPVKKALAEPTTADTVSSIKSPTPAGAAAAPDEQKLKPEWPPSTDQNADHDSQKLIDQRDAQSDQEAHAEATTSETVSSIKSAHGAAAPDEPEHPLSTDQTTDRGSKIVANQQEAEPVGKAHAGPTTADAGSSTNSPSTGSATTPKKRQRHSSNVSGAWGCTHYRTFDRDSKTYRDYSGRRRKCGS